MLRVSDNRRFLVQEDGAPFFYLGDTAWALLNMLQSSHGMRDRDNYQMIWCDYTLEPTKPCMDGEPNYEDVHPGFHPEHGVYDAYDVRKAAYWALFAGAHDHTYGANGVFQFWDGKRPDHFHALKPWHEAIDLPGAAQMEHLRRLLESRPFLDRVPDRQLLVSAPGLGADHTQATRAADGSYAFVYSGSGKPFAVDLSRLSGSSIAASWYDPRTGQSTAAGRVAGGVGRESSIRRRAATVATGCSCWTTSRAASAFRACHFRDIQAHERSIAVIPNAERDPSSRCISCKARRRYWACHGSIGLRPRSDDLTQPWSRYTEQISEDPCCEAICRHGRRPSLLRLERGE